MATYKKGVLGSFNGKVGTIVGSSWRGIDYMKSLGKKNSNPPTEKQLEQRRKFTLITSFFRPVYTFLKIGYNSVKTEMTPVNAAISYHLKNAITGANPNFSVDYTKVVFSVGQLVSASLPVAVNSENMMLTVSWYNNSGGDYAAESDQLTVILYNITVGEFLIKENVATRSDGEGIVYLPEPYQGTSMHCWFSFFSANQSKVSTSVYVGLVTFP